MFEVKIDNPVSPITRSYINKLLRPKNDIDYSLICLGIALLKPRMDFKGFDGKYDYISAQSIAENIAATEAIRDNKYPGFYYFLTSASTFDAIRADVAQTGLKELELISKFAEQELKCSNLAVYISEKTNTAYVICGSNSNALYHLVLAFISLMYPNIFKDKPLTKDEQEVLKAICHRRPNEFIEKLRVLLDPYKTEMVKQELLECFKGYKERRIATAQSNVDNVRTQCDQAMENYRRLVDQLNNAIVLLEGLKVVDGGDNEQENELIEYVSNCPRIHNIKFEANKLNFDVDTILSNIDPQKWERAKQKNDIYSNYRLAEESPFRNSEYRKLFLDAIFGAKPSLYVRMRGNISVATNQNWMDVSRRYSFDANDPVLSNCITNPHFEYHGCPGRNREQISTCLSHGDLVAAIECSIAATGSVNIGETEITFRPFVQSILSSEKKCIQTADNEFVTPKEALLWLLKKEKETAA